MSSLASYAAPFGKDDDVPPINKQNAIQQKRQRNKTLKRRDNQSTISNNPKLEAMMNAINQSTKCSAAESSDTMDNWLNNEEEEDSSDDSKMGKFTPLLPPHSASAEKLNNGKDGSHPLLPSSITEDHSINKGARSAVAENFSQLPGTYAKQYQQQYIPYYNQSSDDLSPGGANRDELLDKLHQIIYMLEEHKNNKNENSTEEIILYFFLGIFIIFIIDSFARVGKYVR